ncbi:MAG: CCA tRNA nucleotidyltransferase [Anaerolineae bacterium]|nr:CCA tRNA nucleotidyltransferase [Gemmatimonadaceae bacterium]
MPPKAVVSILRQLEGAGYETWCVGGAVRDALLGHQHLDWDLATAATPQQVRRLFRRTVPVGIDFGTIGVLDDSGVMHEVTTFRRDVKTDGRHAVVEFGASLDEDLARRDLTINAIAFSPVTGAIRDPFAGRMDLQRGVIRAVGNPDERMREDRLRALRAIRFAARFGFSVDAATWDAIARSAPYLDRLSPERVQQELNKTMQQVEKPSIALEMWRRSGAFVSLLPALASVSNSTLLMVDLLRRPFRPAQDRRRVHRLAALFSECEPSDAERALKLVRFSNSESEWIAQTLQRWRRIAPELERALSAECAASDKDIRSWVAATGRLRVPAVWRLAAARVCARNFASLSTSGFRTIHSTYRRALKSAAHDAVDLADLAIDGNDLRSAGIPPGRAFGVILQRLLEYVIEDQSRNKREWLMREAAQLQRELTGS